jgi:soluble cytochrome b562
MNENISKILKMVEEGKIDAAKAAEQINPQRRIIPKRC